MAKVAQLQVKAFSKVYVIFQHCHIVKVLTLWDRLYMHILNCYQ